MPRRTAVAAVVALVAVLAALGLALKLRRDVRSALEPARADARPLQFVPLTRPARLPELWTPPEVEAVAFPGGDLATAGAAGVRHVRRGDLTPGLPTRRALALALWAGELVVALDAGGVAVERGGAWHELRSGWGALHARALVEAPGGELLIGAREGLFKAAVAGHLLERLDARSVRALAVGPGFVLAGGELGLQSVEPGRVSRVETQEPWVESVALLDGRVCAGTAAGLACGPRAGPLVPVRGGDGASRLVLHEGQLWAAAEPPGRAVRVFDATRLLREEPVPARARRVMAASGLLLADTEDGVYRRDADGWRLALPRAGGLPPGPAHVTALARFRGALVAGLFDGGLLLGEEKGGRLEWRALAGSAAWGTNALVSAGGELWVASLRGAARFDGTTLHPIEGPGAAFSLAATRQGVAIGYGLGVLLPGATLVSAFHGLPGNQATALAASNLLYVGTPSGLGALAERRVVWRVTAGEGKLPHPWVTALLAEEDGLLVGTWGGGLVRRRAGDGALASAPRADNGRWQPFVETEGLQISAGALALANGRAWAGTDANGLWRASRDRARFERVPLPLPSARVSALLAEPGVLWVGTDQGVVRVPIDSVDE